MKGLAELKSLLLAFLKEHNQVEKCELYGIRKDWLHDCNFKREEALYSKYISQIHLKTISEINKEFCQNRIPFFVLKGIPLTYELYGDIYSRISNDIDILLKPKDIVRAAQLLQSMGFQYSGPDMSQKNCRKILEDDEYANHNYYHIQAFISENKLLPPIEVHYEPVVKTTFDYGDKGYDMVDIEECFSCGRMLCINGTSIPVLSLEDQTIHLMDHFTMHFLEYKRWYYSLKNDRCDLNLLFQTAAYIDKYYEIINWGILTDKILQYHIETDIAFTFLLINIIFKIQIPDVLKVVLSEPPHMIYPEKVDP